MTAAELADLHANLTHCLDRLQDVYTAMPGRLVGSFGAVSMRKLLEDWERMYGITGQ